MNKIADLYQTADWKAEKHVPVIECPDNVPKGQMFDVTVSIGKEVTHPNTTDHHIRWIQLFFKPDGDKFSYQIGNYEFCAHGESAKGPDTGPAYTNHSVTARVKLNQNGTLHATSLCNIHGLWENSKQIRVE
jgi:superoxide reductase